MQMDAFDNYRRMLAAPDDGLVAWWYLGETLCELEGWPTMPTLQAETVMVYRTETLDADSFRIHWWEIGYFRDPITGDIADKWRNPITGREASAPKWFEEGPAHYTVKRVAGGIEVDLVQPQAIVKSVVPAFYQAFGQVHLLQTERKARSFPQPDGSIPAPDSEQSADAVTKLSVYASQADLNSGSAWVDCTGSYSFALATLPAWLGFGEVAGRSVTHGRMQKAKIDAPLNPLAWARLQALLPAYFDDGRIKPKWS